MITCGKLIPESKRDVLIVASQNTLIAYGIYFTFQLSYFPKILKRIKTSSTKISQTVSQASTSDQFKASKRS